MDHDDAVTVAHRCHRALDPLHSLIYFAPEAEERFSAVGLRPGRMTYFAGRSAPMGPVGTGVVAATFFNFNPELVARHIPRAWTLADPAAVIAARFDAAAAALRRLLGDDVADSAELAELAGLARTASDACTVEGRPLYAAHAELDWPTEPVLVLWHAISLLREYRGDGHIAALVGSGLSGIEALVTHSATGRGFLPEAAKNLRGWSDEEWSTAVAGLAGKGILDADGGLTAKGAAQREDIEAATGRAALAPWLLLGEERCARVHELGRELSRTAVAAGAFPPGVFAGR